MFSRTSFTRCRRYGFHHKSGESAHTAGSVSRFPLIATSVGAARNSTPPMTSEVSTPVASTWAV